MIRENGVTVGFRLELGLHQDFPPHCLCPDDVAHLTSQRYAEIHVY